MRCQKPHYIMSCAVLSVAAIVQGSTRHAVPVFFYAFQVKMSAAGDIVVSSSSRGYPIDCENGPQQAGAVLEKAQQTLEEQRDALADVAEVLGRKEILSHKDKVSNYCEGFCDVVASFRDSIGTDHFEVSYIRSLLCDRMSSSGQRSAFAMCCGCTLLRRHTNKRSLRHACWLSRLSINQECCPCFRLCLPDS